MIKWLTDCVGTANYMDGDPFSKQHGYECLDVRDLVDKRGNTSQSIERKIEEGVELLRQGKKIVVCCDYGMSRSNSIAVGIISKYMNRRYDEVVKEVLPIVGEGAIKLEVLNMVRESLEKAEQPVNESSILITGASGFIGHRLMEELRRQGYNVIAPSSVEINLEQESIPLALLVQQANPSTIVHLANPRIYTQNAAMGKTLAMLKNVLDVCSATGIKLVYPSSWEVYSGYASEKLLAFEGLPLFAKGTYGETKLLCEQLICNYHMQYDLKYLIIRFPPLYGGGSERPKFIYNFIDKALKNQPITTHIYRNGPPHLDLLYIDDAVKALQHIIVKDLTGEYNVGSGYLISTQKAAEIIVKATNSKSEISHNFIEGYAPNIMMDASKMRKQTGWQADMDFEEWIRQELV